MMVPSFAPGREIPTGIAGLGSKDTPDNPCATQWAWAIPSCWKWLTDSVYGNNYPTPPMPKPVASTLPDGSPIPAVPVSAAQAQHDAQSISDAQIRQAQAGNQIFFDDLDVALQDPKDPGTWPSWVWLAVAAGVGVLVLVKRER